MLMEMDPLFTYVRFHRITSMIVYLNQVYYEVELELHYKLCYISDFEGRSINRQILYLIRQCIRQFEEKEGCIEVPDEAKAGQ